jgi:transposase
MVTKKARCAYQRIEIMELVYAGESQSSIAKKLDVHPRTVRRAVLRFYETDSKYPARIDPETVELRRTEQDETLGFLQQELLAANAKLPEPTSAHESVENAKAVCAIALAYSKLSDSRARLYGLNAIVPTSPQSVTNMLVAGGNEVEYLKNLAKLKELENGHRQQPLVP